MKTILILFLAIIISSSSHSQVTEEWVKRHTGTGAQDDVANDITTDAAGNLYVTGNAYGLFGESNFFTIKYDAAGNILWSKSYDGGGLQDDFARNVEVDAAGNVYVTGSSRQTDSTGMTFATIKYNSAGTQQWVRHTNIGNEHPRDMKLDASGNIYVTGYFLSFPYGRVVTVKYNSAGTQQWLTQYYPSNTSYYEGTCIEVDASGNVYVGGYYGATQNGNIHLIKYNSSGVQQWVRNYTSSGGTIGVGDIINDMALDASGNIFLTGQAKGMSGSNGPDMITLKYNSSGTLQWVQKYNSANNNTDIAYCIGVDASGNAYIGGFATPNSNTDLALVKYNSAGTQEWVRTVNGQGNANDAVNGLVLDAAGNVYLTGQSTGLGTAYNYITLRYNPSGTQIWSQTYLGPGNANDNAYAIALGTNGAVYVTGKSQGTNSGSDFATVKYGQTVGVQYVNSEIPDKYSLGQNYPNPFNPVTNIKFSIPKASNVKLAVFDIQGREIAQLVNQELGSGIYNVDFDASHLASGTYFYRMETADFSDVKKMILIK
jgi:uncharacterized delta-60 repeat protein